MTVIVYRDGVLAADSQITFGETAYYNRKKVAKHLDMLFGSAGPTTECNDFMEWARRQEGAPPMFKKGNGIMVGPNLLVWIFLQGSRTPILHEEEYYATGCGESTALGALAMGATAIEAVEATIKHNVYCGGPVVAVKL